MNTKSGAFGIIFKNDAVLLVKRRDMPLWTLPGGYIESGETPEQGVIREVYEETGYEVVINKKVGEYEYPNAKRTTHTFICTIQSGKATLSNESSAIEYFHIHKLPQMLIPYIDTMIKDAVKNSPSVIKTTFPKLPLSFWIKSLLHPWALFKYLLVKVGIHWNT
jgi:mutator protein MutT